MPTRGFIPRLLPLVSIAAAAAFAALAAHAAPQQLMPFEVVPFATDSGVVRGRNGDAPRHARVVAAPGASWVRVRFDASATDLGTVERGEARPVVRITSLADGHEQTLDAVTIAQWRHRSAYFNGDAVEIALIVPEGATARVSVEAIEAGLATEGAVATICGPTDDRVPANDPRVGRIMPTICTGWLFDGRPNAMLTAGHCFDPLETFGAEVVEFNVPLSTASGDPQHPPPSEQYAIDPASVVWAHTATGDDWAHFGVFANPVTGLPPLAAQGSSFTTAAPAATPEIRVTGFGFDFGAASATNQTHAGPFVEIAGNIVRHRADTEPGNSGSPMARTSDGRAIAIHTDGFCSPTGGANEGTALTNPALVAAIANPLGIAAATTGCGLGNASCYAPHAAPHCSDGACCAAVCAIDPFCCGTRWDAICAASAADLCGGCGTVGASCYQARATPGCEDPDCCGAICAVDAYCCGTAWDSLCVARADSTCRSGATCSDAIRLSTQFPSSFDFNTSTGNVFAGAVCGVLDPRGTWRRVRATCSGLVALTVCTEFTSGQVILSVRKACDGAPIACSTPTVAGCSLAPLGAARVVFGAVDGDEFLVFVTTAGAGTSAAGTLEVSCAPVCGTGPSCTVEHLTPGCGDAACCATICTIDPFCCESYWDSFCATRATSTCYARPGDLNGDGVVNGVDLGTLLGGWSGSAGDLNGDGIVNAADLAVLLGNWG
jgi:V8-like Glu-specific endopeptidase